VAPALQQQAGQKQCKAENESTFLKIVTGYATSVPKRKPARYETVAECQQNIQPADTAAQLYAATI